MKKFRRVLLAAVFAVILALGAVCITACGDKSGGDNNTKPRYTLTFMYGTELWETVSAEEGSAYTLNKGNPSRPSYVFDGWSQKPNGEVEQLPDKMPSGNRTYYAVFSARFNLSFNAGIGSIPDDKKTMIVKEGSSLYELVSTIAPTVPDGDATFKGWFLRGTSEITSTSGQKMPNGNVEVVAKYSVGYKINVYKEIGLDSDSYAEVPDDVVNQTAYVGEKVASIPSYSGYYYDGSKDNDVLYANLNKNSAQNVFELYYKLIGYDTVFNANFPSDVTYTGTMDGMTCGHGEEYTVPECQFDADGYRFCGWSVTPDGAVVYRTGDKFSVERATTFYAQWVKGLTEISGISSDRVYIMNNPDEPHHVIAYLERVGMTADIVGEYNPTTHVFSFRNADGPNPDDVLLRGIADSAHNTFTYLNTENTTVYKLQNIDKTVDASVTLTLSDNGDAVYFDGTDTKNGRYVGANDGSMLFTVDGEAQFAFRLIYSSENALTNFIIRGEEYGTWNNITQAGTVDAAYTLELDGYGSATMYVAGSDSSLLNTVTTTCGGRYVYTTGDGAYYGNAGKEIRVRIYNSSLNYRVFDCLLMTGTYQSSSVNDTTVYTRVYLPRFAVTTLYGVPAEGEALNTETADKIELAGYSVVDDSATYTYTDNNGQAVTVKGKYSYDSTAGTLRIIPSVGEALLFEVSVFGEGNDAVAVFEPVQALFGQYVISGLDNVYGPCGMYEMYIYNNNFAAFAFMLPMDDDTFYGNIVWEYERILYGQYSLAEEGKTETDGSDPRANVYEFTANISPEIISYVYSIYEMDISSFARFKFKFVYSDTTNHISYVNVTAVSDLQSGRKLTYNDVEYTLDGYGTAESEIGNVKYTYDSSTVSIVPDDSKPKETVLYIDLNGSYIERVGGYSTVNCGYPFFMTVFKDDTAILTLDSASMSNAFSLGQITWDDDNHTSGTYVRDDGTAFSDVYAGINKTIKDFKFTVGATKNNGGEDVRVIYVYDVNASVSEESDEIVIVNSAGDELVLNRSDGTAKYTKHSDDDAGDTEYNGSFVYVGNKVQFTYSEQSQGHVLSFILEYGNDGAIIGFHSVGSEAGYVLDSEDFKSYLYLTGEETAVEGVYSAVYSKYSAESEDYTTYNGTYCLTKKENVAGYDFTYQTGEVNNDGEMVTETFTFATGVESGVKLFQKYTIKLDNIKVYFMSASDEQPVQIGTLIGGEYAVQVFTVSQTQYQGKMEWNDDWEVWVFTADNGTEFYFKDADDADDSAKFVLDGTYVPETKGMFTLSDTVDIDVPAVSAVPAHTAHVTKIEISGMAYAYLHYDYNGEDRVISGIYVQYAADNFAFIMSGNSSMILRFRILTYTNGETGEVTYVARLADMDYYGAFVGDDFAVINLDGFETAYFVDGFGIVYDGQFEIVNAAETTALIRIRYNELNKYSTNEIYARLDLENRTFVLVAAP